MHHLPSYPDWTAYCFCPFFETGSCCVAQTGLKFPIVLPIPPKLCNRPGPLHQLVYLLLVFKPNTQPSTPISVHLHLKGSEQLVGVSSLHPEVPETNFRWQTYSAKSPYPQRHLASSPFTFESYTYLKNLEIMEARVSRIQGYIANW